MRKWVFPATLLWLVAFAARAGIFHDSNLDWQTLETDHFYIHFHQHEEALAQRFAPVAEEVYQELGKLLNWYPEEKTEVVLTDEYDVSNGFARVFPRNTIVLLLSAPDSLNSLEDHDGWLELVFRHEYLHIVHLDKVRGVPSGFQNVFGRHPLLFPNAYQPRWFIEGIATYVETDNQQGTGRGQSSYYDMLMRMESMGGIKPVRQVNQRIGSWPAGSIPYLYGVHFFNFVRDRYGEKKLLQLLEEYSDNLIPFRINSNSSYVLGKDIAGLWDEFAVYLEEKYREPVAAIRAKGLQEGRAMTREGYQAGPLVAYDDRFYFIAFNGKSHNVLKSIDSAGNVQVLADVNPAARIDVTDKGILITQPELCRNARVYYDIYRLDHDGSNLTRLTKCARYRQAVWSHNSKNIYAVHNELGQNTLWLLDSDGKQVKSLWQGNNNEQLASMAWSDSTGKLVVSMWQKDKGWNLASFDFANSKWIPLTQDHFIEADPVFTPDGKSLLYSSDENGVYNIYRLHLGTGERVRLTNVIGGAFMPAMLDNRLAYIGYQREGFDVYYLDDPVTMDVASLKVAEIKAGSADSNKPLSIVPENEGESAEIKTAPIREYSGLPSLAPTWWTPILFVDDQRTELGISTGGTDALNRHNYSFSYVRDFENDLNIGSFSYLYDGFYPLIHVGFFRDTDFYLDASDNLVRIRAEDQVVLETIFPFASFDDRVFLHAAVATEKHTDVWVNGVAPLPDSREDFAGIALRYDSTHRYPLSVSRSEGRELRLIYEDTDAFGDSDRKGQVTVGEWREFIHFGSSEHVLALRVVEAHGKNNPDPFSLGGIQDNDDLFSVIFAGESSPLFDKREYSLRGYDEGHAQLRGQNMRLFSLEYRFPLWRIEHGWMAPPFGFNQIHGTLFYDAGGVWNTGNEPVDYYEGAGFELNTDLDLFYNVRVNIALGFARGLDDTLGEDKAYLRIGSHF